MLSLIDNILFEALPYSFLALGLVLTFRYLRVIDLTFAASFAVAPAVAGALLVQGQPFGIALIAAASGAIALALLTLLLISLLELDSLLAGLLTSFAGFSVALLFTQGTLSIRGASTPVDAIRAYDFQWLENGLPLHPAQIASLLALLLVAKVGIDWFLRSEFGLAFRAMEDERSRHALLASIGLSYWGLLGGGLIAGNLLAGLSGLLIMLKEGQVTANRGFDAFLATIAAYLFGMMLFERRARRFGETNALSDALSAAARFGPTTAAVLGVIFYFALLFLVARLDVPSSTPKLVMIGLVIAAFGATRWSDIRSRFARRTHLSIVRDGETFHARNVHVAYPGYPKPNVVLREGALTLKPGEAVLLTGPNGSGKSTLLRYLAGRTEGVGEITVPGKRRRSRSQLIGYVSQDAQIGSASVLTVSENLALFRRNGAASVWRRWRPPADAELPAAARALIAASDRPALLLSGGQRQVLNISAMLVRPDAPSVVLFDEPLTHLDEHNASACVELMEHLLREGRAILVVQHDIGMGSDANTNSSARARLARLLSRVVSISEIEGQAT
jgi:putative ABC transport system permease protein